MSLLPNQEERGGHEDGVGAGLELKRHVRVATKDTVIMVRSFKRDPNAYLESPAGRRAECNKCGMRVATNLGSLTKSKQYPFSQFTAEEFWCSSCQQRLDGLNAPRTRDQADEGANEFGKTERQLYNYRGI